MSSKLYYHFTSDKLRDGTKIPKIGEWLIYPKKPIICVQGLHASEHPFDALKYAPGNLLHLVELRSIETEQDDKVVAKGRRIISTINSTELLQRSARKFALDVIDLWNPPDIVKEYLITGDTSKAAEAARAAWAAKDTWAARATWTTARAARDAAWAAAKAAEAAWAAKAPWAAWATWAAARVARDARTTARDARAARDAAWAAAEAAKQRKYFLSEVKAEFGKCGSYGI